MLGIGWSSMADELIEQVAQGFIMSWADAQDGGSVLDAGSPLMRTLDARDDRDAILQAGYRQAVDRFVTPIASR